MPVPMPGRVGPVPSLRMVQAEKEEGMCEAESCCCLAGPGCPRPPPEMETRQCQPHGHFVPLRTNPDPQVMG